jgi:hypothetical protein
MKKVLIGLGIIGIFVTLVFMNSIGVSSKGKPPKPTPTPIPTLPSHPPPVQP